MNMIIYIKKNIMNFDGFQDFFFVENFVSS